MRKRDPDGGQGQWPLEHAMNREGGDGCVKAGAARAQWHVHTCRLEVLPWKWKNLLR